MCAYDAPYHAASRHCTRRYIYTCNRISRRPRGARVHLALACLAPQKRALPRFFALAYAWYAFAAFRESTRRTDKRNALRFRFETMLTPIIAPMIYSLSRFVRDSHIGSAAEDSPDISRPRSFANKLRGAYYQAAAGRMFCRYMELRCFHEVSRTGFPPRLDVEFKRNARA